MNHEIIIARYNENIDWITEIPDFFNVIVYNKGNHDINKTIRNRINKLIDLENSGRESDTFLRHILEKDDFDENYSVFLQGNPFEHSPDIHEILGAIKNWDDIQPLSLCWLESENVPPQKILEKETIFLNERSRVRPEMFSLTTWGPIQFYDVGIYKVYNSYLYRHRLSPGINIASDFLLRCEWPELAEVAQRSNVGRFSYGAQFAVKTKNLEKIPKHTLALAIQATNSFSTYGYIIERLWLHLCGMPFIKFC